MKTPSVELQKNLNNLIIKYHQISIEESELMTHWENIGLQGFKRRSRQYSRWASESGLMVRCKLSDLYKITPQIAFTYTTVRYASKPPLEVLKYQRLMYNETSDLICLCKKMSYDETALENCEMLEKLLEWNKLKVLKISRDIQAIENTMENTVYMQQLSEKLHDKWKLEESKFISGGVSY